MKSVQLIKKCLENPEYGEGVSGALEFLDQEGQGIGELRKIVDDLNSPDLFNEDDEE